MLSFPMIITINAKACIKHALVYARLTETNKQKGSEHAQSLNHFENRNLCVFSVMTNYFSRSASTYALMSSSWQFAKKHSWN
ncbi:hypothetical protein DFP78_10784 [Photobacterium lutimaris]|nr:hypothetical protein DFP78_10784 [Photobacterium lutimaris]